MRSPSRYKILLEEMVIFMEITAEFNQIFEPVHKSKQRYIAMRGSAGSGKSVDTAQMYIVRLLQNPQRNLMCVRKVEASNKNSTFAELCGAINRMGVSSHFTTTTSPLGIKCRAGNQIIFCGTHDEKQREKLKSITVPNGKITDVWEEEPTELTPDDFEIIDDRLRGELPKGLFYQHKLTFNPVNSQHWIKKRFFDYPSKDVLCHKSTYLDNKFIDQAYYDRMERRRILDPEGYQIYGLGEWGETSGIIFSNWEVKEFDFNFDDEAIGQDFGFNHANAILKLGIKDGNIYICSEQYEREKDTSEHIEMANALTLPKNKIMWCDSAEPDRIKMWSKAGYRAMPVHKHDGCVKGSIDWLKQRKIYIHPDCTNTISEISGWRWKKDRDGNYLDEPVPIMDDAMAALRYGCEYWIRIHRVNAKPVKEIKPVNAFDVVRMKYVKPNSLGVGKPNKPF